MYGFKNTGCKGIGLIYIPIEIPHKENEYKHRQLKEILAELLSHRLC